MKNNYTPEQIEFCKRYLSDWVEDYGGDEQVAADLIEREAWGEVFEMMDKGDMAMESEIDSEGLQEAADNARDAMREDGHV